MKRIRLTVPLIAVVLALIPSSAIASTYQESVFGVETGFPQTAAWCPIPHGISSFAGIAHGTRNGVFNIAVCHTALNTSATILGGTFMISNGTTTPVTGYFASGGTVSAGNSIVFGSSCIQRYAVSGDLQASPSPPPSGHFTGTLVHYGVWTGFSCNPLLATISGHAEF